MLAAAVTRRDDVRFQQSAEPLTRHHAVVAARLYRCRRDQSIAQALMVAFVMIVRGEFADGSPELARQKAITGIRQVPTHLAHPSGVGL